MTIKPANKPPCGGLLGEKEVIIKPFRMPKHPVGKRGDR